MAVYDIQVAKTSFSELLKRALSGEEVVIVIAGKPVARIVPYASEDASSRLSGIDRGEVLIMPDFDTELSEFDQ